MIRILELFGGIGACSKALERLGIDYKITDYVEIDKYAVASFNAMHGTNFEPQDICEWDKNTDVDLIMHGSPCQDFSLAGKQAGGDEGSGTRSSLMYETIRIVEKLKPKYVIWKNVKNVISKKHKHNYDNYCNKMSELGYKSYGQVLNAKDYGIPQNRERVFTISIRNDLNQTFEFPPKQELKLKLKDMLEDNVDDSFYLSDDKIEKISHWKAYQKPFERVNGNTPIIKIKNNTKKGYLEAHSGDGVYTNPTTKRGTVQKEMIPTLTTFQDKGVVVKDNKSSQEMTKELLQEVEAGKYNDGNVYSKHLHQSSRFNDKPQKEVSATIKGGNMDAGIINGLRIRKLTPKECWRLMGFDDEDFEKAQKVNSNAQLYKQAGNSIVVNVLERILENLIKKDGNL